jgi:hypothetical protein
VLPHLFGEPGRPLSPGYATRVIAGNCVTRDFVAFALDRTSPLIAWLRALAHQAHEECGGPGAGVVGMRFSADVAVPPEQFETLRRELGDAFIGVEIDSSPGNAYGIPRRAHSVLTNDLVDEPGHPTRAALDKVLTFLQDRLHVTSPGVTTRRGPRT